MTDPQTLIVQGGQVLTMDPALPPTIEADVVIRDGRIVDVVRTDDDRPDPARLDPGARVVDAAGCVVMPGFIDTHRHNWQAPYRGIAADWTLDQYVRGIHRTVKPLLQPEDLYIGNRLGRLEALRSGVTTLLDWSHGMTTHEQADAAVEGLRSSLGRSVFGYSPHFGPPDNTDISADLVRMAGRFSDLEDDRVTLCLALRGPQYSDIDVVVKDVSVARELGLRVTVHGGSSSWGKRRPVAAMHEKGLLDEVTTVVHCNALQDDEIDLIASTGATVSISPEVEMSMGFGFPATRRLLRAGIRPSLSVDNCASMAGDMFSTMRTTVLVERALDTERPDDVRPRLTAWDALDFAITQGALAIGMSDRLGVLAPGYTADLVVLRLDEVTVLPGNNPAGTVVFSGHPGLVDTVVVGGEVVVSAGTLVGVDLDQLRREVVDSRDRVLGTLRASGAGEAMGRGDGTWLPAA